MIWVGTGLALAIHDRQLVEHGGRPGIRDKALLESAIARPRQLATYGDPAPDMPELAASLAVGLVRNMPFADGNKRTAHVCYRVFLALNQVDAEHSQADMYLQMLGLADGSVSEAEFSDWLRRRSR